MDLELTDRVAVVIGASQGSGLAVTLALVEEGAYVVARSGNTDNLDGLDRVTAMPVNPPLRTDRPDWSNGRSTSTARSTCWFNNVGGVRTRPRGFLGTSDEEFEWAMQMNLFTGLRATRAPPAPMLEQPSGLIVNVASVNSFFEPDAGTID